MSFEKIICSYKAAATIIPDEQKIQETVVKSIDAFYTTEQARSLSYWEFLLTQLKLIKKRWWIFQFLLLLILWLVLPSLHNEYLIQRTLGVISSLFVILVIPEFWKNQTCQSMEIEASSFYSLKQIYAARMLLFGVVDITYITLFCSISFVVLHITFSQLLIQFILPMTVTSCICFGVLCKKQPVNETYAEMICIVWNAIWLLVVLNEKIYTRITIPLWITFFMIALITLVLMIYRTIHDCNANWEVSLNDISNK